MRSFKLFESTLVDSPIHPNCRISVIVPVRNEAENLNAALAALSRQIDLQGRPLDPSTYEIILLANNCTDNSAAVARQFQRQHPELALHVVEKTFAPAEAYIGRVRQVLMDEAHRRLTWLGRPRGIIASTDGDTEVSPTWLAAIQHEIDLGADGVSGRIMTTPRDRARLDPYTRACCLRAVGYGYLCVALEALLDPDPFDDLPRHHQHCGASLAVTAEMYAKAGGMPPVRTPEDMAFYRSLVRVDARFRHSPLVWVRTSARQQGRTSNGMANQLSEWSALGHRQQPYLVEPALATETRFRQRQLLRKAWYGLRRELSTTGPFDPGASETKYSGLKQLQSKQASLHHLASLLEVDQSWLIEEIACAATFGALYERWELHRAEQGWYRQWHHLPIEQAIFDLRNRINELRQNPGLKTAGFGIGC